MKRIFQFAAAGLTTLVLTSAASRGAAVLYASTFLENELLTFDVATGQATPAGTLGNTSPYGLAVRNGELYTFDPNLDRVRQIDPISGSITGTPIDIGVGDRVGEGDIAFRADGVGFLSSALDGNTLAVTNDLFSFDLVNGTSTRIGTTRIGTEGITLDGLAFGPTGTLFALGQGQGQLLTVDPATGAVTVVGDLGVPQDSPFGALTFSENGTLYAAIDDALYTVNTSTGMATAVNADGTDFGSISGLAFVPVPEPASLALIALGMVFCERRRRRSPM